MGNIFNPILIFGARYLFLFVIIIAFIWLLKQPRSKQKEITFLFCICLPIIIFIFYLASRLYYNPRPFVAGHFTPLISHKANNGFPSHHVLLASVFSAVVFLFNWRIGAFLWILTIFVGISRVYVGVHHIVDVVASIWIAIIPVTLIYLLLKYLKNHKPINMKDGAR